MKKKVLIAGLITVAIVAGSMLTFNACNKSTQKIAFETVKVTRGTVRNAVTATGTIEALKTVSVGTQVSGVISKIYVDFNSHVKKGQLLAELEKTTLLASLENAQATLDDAQAEMTYQTANYNRIKTLYEKSLVAQTDYDLALYNYLKALASLKVAKSGFDKAKINLNYATIYSPIDGVVLNRAVDEGQTVAASFSTPELFSIANDLTQMQVAASIDEADIGQVKKDQKVEFTVDAFPDRKFLGKVTQIRLESVTTSNVVTYTVIVGAANPGEILMPGMTASISVFVNEAENVLIVPSKTLRFVPDENLLAAFVKSLPENERPQKNVLTAEPKPSGEASSKTSVGKDTTNTATEVWIKNGNKIYPVKVEVGINDDKNAEVKTGLNEGEDVIISMSSSAIVEKKAETATTSPFMPKRPGKK